MRVLALELHNFRNYPQLLLEPGPGLNVFVGENAQGKSNVIESLYVLATTKSARANRDVDLILCGQTQARVRARVDREKRIAVLAELELSTTEKKAGKINGVRHTRMSDVIGQVNAALFDSSDLGIVRGEPAIRRRFLDLEISQTSPRYVHALGAYRKALDQRNRLLRDMRERKAGPGAIETLRVLSAQLATHGALLIEGRQSFLRRLSMLAGDVHHRLSDKRDQLTIGYLPSVPIPDGVHDLAGIRDAILAEFRRIEPEECARGVTLIGPQRDDMELLVNGGEGRTFGSQGQQRTIALGMKLAERQLIEELTGEPPLLLLDDVLSDLDDLRRSHLFEFIHVAGSQTFLTCTSLRSFPPDILEMATVFRVVAGKVSRESG